MRQSGTGGAGGARGERGCVLGEVVCLQLSFACHLTNTSQTPDKHLKNTCIHYTDKHLHQLYACHLRNTCINYTIQVCGRVYEGETAWARHVHLDGWLEVRQPASERARENEGAREGAGERRETQTDMRAHVLRARVLRARVIRARGLINGTPRER